MNNENIDTVKAAFTAAVRSAVAKGNHQGWGQDDSVAVIAAVATEAFSSGGDFADCERYVAQVVNPSAFAQVLEKLETSHPAHIRRPGKGQRKSSVAGDL